MIRTSCGAAAGDPGGVRMIRDTALIRDTGVRRRVIGRDGASSAPSATVPAAAGSGAGRTVPELDAWSLPGPSADVAQRRWSAPPGRFEVGVRRIEDVPAGDVGAPATARTVGADRDLAAAEGPVGVRSLLRRLLSARGADMCSVPVEFRGQS